ncbi:flagellar hook-length control protein FliK [Onishia taeanensis]
MDIIGFIPSSASASGKAAGRQAIGSEQGASQDFNTLLAKRQTQSDATGVSPAKAESTSQQTPMARVKEALSTLSPQQQDALSALQQDPAALERLTSSQQDALASLLEGGALGAERDEALGEQAASDLKAALSALGSLPLDASASLAMAPEAPGEWSSEVASTLPGDASRALEPSETPDAPLALSMIAERMNLIDQAGGSTGVAGQGDKAALAGNALAAGDARRGPPPLHAEWLNHTAAIQAKPDASGLGRQGVSGTAFTDAAASALLAEAGDARNATFSMSSASADTPAFSAGSASPLQGASALSASGLSASGLSTSALSASAQAGGGALTAPVASQQWQQQLGQQLLGMTQRGEQQMELKLHPADLGPLSVSLKVAEHGAQAQFLSAHPQVRSALEQAIPQLREALAQQGITLGDTSVGHQASGQSQDQSQEQSLAGRQPPSPNGIGDDGGLEAQSMVSPQGPLTATPLDGRVDLYA